MPSTRRRSDHDDLEGTPIVILVAGAALLIAVLGCLYLVAAAVLVARFAKEPAPRPPTPAPGVALMKPLCGAEPELSDNLASFCRQDYPGPVTLICGVQSSDDGAIAVVEALRRAFPERVIDLVVDPRLHGTNRKVSNLINMATRIDQPIVIVSDSDVRVAPDYLARVITALSQHDVGGVTCFYYGLAGEGQWSEMAALGINAHFLPSVIVGLALGRARPCFGSTIALRRATLDALGGFAAFADHLADDYAIGAALRARGLRVAIPRFAVAHRCEFGHWRDMLVQELRWARTIRSIDPVGHAGSAVMHPLAWAFLSLFTGGGTPALVLAFAAIACRLVLIKRIERSFALAPHPYWLIPMRDLFSAAVYAASFLGRDVAWRGRNYRIGADGHMSEREQAS
jgi:ceramide glucosyltransferase